MLREKNSKRTKKTFWRLKKKTANKKFNRKI